MKCSIIIPVFNKANFTKHCLECLSHLSRDDYEVIVFDNGSTDNTEEVVSKFDCKYIKNNTNVGFSQANNISYKQALGEYILFLNNDIKVNNKLSDWPELLIKEAEDGSLVGSDGGYLDKNFEFIKAGRGLPRQKYWYLSGWCVCAKKETFNKLAEAPGKPWWNGTFCFFEDVNMSWRANELNIPIKEVVIPVTHIGHVTAKSEFNITKLYKEAQKIFKEKWKDKL